MTACLDLTSVTATLFRQRLEVLPLKMCETKGNNNAWREQLWCNLGWWSAASAVVERVMSGVPSAPALGWVLSWGYSVGFRMLHHFSIPFITICREVTQPHCHFLIASEMKTRNMLCDGQENEHFLFWECSSLIMFMEQSHQNVGFTVEIHFAILMQIPQISKASIIKSFN